MPADVLRKKNWLLSWGKRVENRLYYYRDRDQKKGDLIYVKDEVLYPIEIKKSIGKDKQRLF